MSEIFDLNTLENGRPGAARRMGEAFAATGLRFEEIARHAERQRPQVSGSVNGAGYVRQAATRTEWIEGALVLPPTVLSNRYALPYLPDRDLWLAGDAVNQLPTDELVLPRLPDPDAVRPIERAILIGGRGASTFGHWLLDFVPQLLTARALERRLGLAPPILVTNFTPFGRRFLRFLGLEQRCVFLDRDTPVRVSELWLPLVTKLFWDYSIDVLSASYAHLLAVAVADGRLPPRDRLARLLVARRKPPHCTNFDALRAALEPLGFTTVHPEMHPYRQQFQLFRHAEIVVGEDGSAMHNAGFCRPGTPIVVFSRGTKVNWWHGAVAQAAGAPLTYLQSTMTGPQTYEAPVDEILRLV